MKILLVHPPMDGAQPPTRRTENLGLGYIASVLRRDGHTVEIFDGYLRCLNFKETLKEILNREFDAVGITAYDIHKKTLIALAKGIKKRRKDVIVFAGGYFPTFWADQLMPACPELDFVVRGEGELVVSDVIARISRDEEWHDTPGIAFLKGKKAILNPLPPLVEDLDDLPFPARDELMATSSRVPAMIASSRGCYHRCAFCSIPSFYKLSGGLAPRFRSPVNVLDEIEQVISDTGIKEFVFTDDNFIGPGRKNRERVLAMAEEMRKRNLGFTFTIECRVDDIDEEILNILKSVGLTRVFLGIESGVQRQLDTYNKRTTVEQNKQAIEMVRRLGLDMYAGLITMDPYVTVGELTDNIQFARDMQLSGTLETSPLATARKLVLFGGVPLIEKIREDGLLREKPFNRYYVFKDPTFRLVHGAAVVMSSPVALLNKVKGVIALRKRTTVSGASADTSVKADTDA